MANSVCRYCGSLNLLSRNVEIRQVNLSSLRIASRQFVTEVECRDCGWMGAEESVVRPRQGMKPRQAMVG